MRVINVVPGWKYSRRRPLNMNRDQGRENIIVEIKLTQRS